MESYAQPLRRRGVKAIAAGVVALTALIGGSTFVMLRFDGYVKAIYEHNTAPIRELAEIRARATDIRRLLWRLVALRGREEERQAIAAIQCYGYCVAVFYQALPEQFRHPALILDY